MKEQRSKSTPRRLLAWALAVCMALTLLPGAALAQGGQTQTVTGFDELAAEVREQTVPVGTALNALHLPDTLQATVYAVRPDTAQVAQAKPAMIEGVKWQSKPAYDADTAGTYTFTAALPDGYAAAGAALPTVTVTVENAGPAPVQITGWSWVDEWGALAEGVLAVPNASENAPLPWENLTAILPGEIAAETAAGPQTVALAGWDCPDYPDAGTWTGTYTATATLPEGYALAKGAAALEISVEFLRGPEQTIETYPTPGDLVEVTLNSATNFYDTLTAAVAAVNGAENTSGAEFKLLKDITNAETSAFTNNVTIDLNGHTWTGSANEYMAYMGVVFVGQLVEEHTTNSINDFTVTITDSKGGGSIVGGTSEDAGYSAVTVTEGTLALTGDKAFTLRGNDGAYSGGHGVDVNRSGTGNVQITNPNVILQGGSVSGGGSESSAGCGLLAANSEGTYEITGGIFRGGNAKSTGSIGLYLQSGSVSGNLKVTEATGGTSDSTERGGYGLATEIKVSIEGGTFTGTGQWYAIATGEGIKVGELLAEECAYYQDGLKIEDVSLLNASILAQGGTIVVAPPHPHCVCGGSVAVGDHTSHTNVDYAPLPANFTGGALAGNYYLTGDVELTEKVTIATGATVNLCLNGYKLDANGGDFRVIENSGTLNLCDCNGSGHGSGKVTGAQVNSGSGGGVKNTGAFCLYGGEITGNQTTDPSGGGVYSDGDNASFTMYSGSITGNTSGNSGGGVYSTAPFTMYGGSISGNTSANYGGGVYSSSPFTMYGGSITGNTAAYGGGVYSTALFTMSGGSISDNTATDSGGGVDFFSSSSTFTFSGGSITDNTAAGDGGGVRIGTGTFALTGGEITKNKVTSANSYGGGVYSSGNSITLQGDVTVSGNVKQVGGADSVGSNFCGGTMTLTGVLTGTGKIGITSYYAPTVSYPKTIVEGGASYSTISATDAEKFVSDSDLYKTYLDSTDNQVKLGLLRTVSYDVNGGTGTAPESGKYLPGESVTLPNGSGLSKDGYTFQGWARSSSATSALTSWTLPSSYSERYILYAVWAANATAPALLGSDPSVTVGQITGNMAVLFSTAADHTYTFAWYTGDNADGTPIPGADASSYAIPINLTVGTHKFTVKVIASKTGVASSSATHTFTVTVKNPAATAPAASAATIDYENETITFADTLELNPKNDFTGTAITSGGGITDYIPAAGQSAATLYLRVKETEDTWASPATVVSISARPAAPQAKTTTPTADGITVTNAAAGEEYVLVKKTAPAAEPDWSQANTTGVFTGLEPNTAYTLYARTKATTGAFVSAPVSADVKTLVALGTTAVTGAGKDKDGNGVHTPKLNAAGTAITYSGSYAEGYTPSIKIGNKSQTVTLNAKTKTWTYTYTVQDDDGTVSAEVTFAARQIASLSAPKQVPSLYADDENNQSAAALKRWLDGNVKVKVTYDNGTTDEIAATFTTENEFIATGGDYTYTAAVGEKSCEVTVKVVPVTATPESLDGITLYVNPAGYADYAAIGLPEKAEITYAVTGDAGYTVSQEEFAITWSTAVPADFGKAPTAQPQKFEGAVTLPGWATGEGKVTVAVSVSDKTDISGKLAVTLTGWTYGAAANTPAVTLNSAPITEHLTFSYTGTDSADAPADAGRYTVSVYYEDETQIGTAKADFFIAPAPLTITGGTVAAKAYDGNTDAKVTAVTFDGLQNGETLALDTDYTVTGAAFADAGIGQNKAVTATVTLKTTDKAQNYTLTSGALTAKGNITAADGKLNPAYTETLEALRAVHIVTNVTPTLADVELPEGWRFTGDTAARLTARNENSGKQSFAVQYTSADPNYGDVALTGDDALFPVSTVALEVDGGLDMRSIESIGGTLTLSPVELKVTGAALPATGKYAITNMEWSSSVARIATVSGEVSSGRMSAAVTSHAKGVTMVGVAYKNGGGMLGYVLVQVVAAREDSSNSVNDLKDITETLDKLIDPASPSETDKKAVDAVADELTKLPDEQKEALTIEDIRALDELKTAVGQNITDADKRLTVTIDTTPAEQTTAPERVEVVGAAIASGADSGAVKVYVTPVQPTASEAKLELDLKLEVNNNEQQLASPLFFSMELPASVDVSRLTIKHLKSDGSTENVPFTYEGQTVSFKLSSFSGLQFLVESEKRSSSHGTSSYTITATAGLGGSITPSGKVSVAQNSDKTFTVAAKDGYEIADVLVDGQSVGAVGSYTFKKVDKTHTIEARFQQTDGAADGNPFRDVSTSDWFYDSVQYVYEQGLMNGTGAATFSPYISTTRGMIVTILWRMESQPESGASMAFTDVKAGSYCHEAVAWAAAHGIVKGYDAHTFGPDDTITREQLAAILYRYGGYKGNDVSASGDHTRFTDQPSAWAREAVSWAVGAGILTGKTGDQLDPLGSATRAEAAAMLDRFHRTAVK